MFVGFNKSEFLRNGESESIFADVVVRLEILCKDKRGGRPLNLGGTGVAPCICAFRSVELE